MTVGNQIASFIRTAVPIGIGFLLSLLARETGVVLDADSSAGLASGFAALAAAVYYQLVRWLESKVSWLGWLLGLAVPPSYEGSGSGTL